MKLLRIIFVILLSNLNTFGQDNKWFKGNDSAVRANINHFNDYCKNLVSSKSVDKKKVKLDNKIIMVSNELFNKVSTVEDLKVITRKFRNKTFEIKKTDTATLIVFRPYSNGNLRLSYYGVFKDDLLFSQRFSLGTSTKVGCSEPKDYELQYFDVVYIKEYFLDKIEFPFLITPLTADFEVRK